MSENSHSWNSSNIPHCIQQLVRTSAAMAMVPYCFRVWVQRKLWFRF